MKQFNQKTVVISGGAEGIGYSIATALGHAGANLVIADIDSDTLEQAKSSLTESGFNVLAVQMDVTQPEQWEQVANAAEAQGMDVRRVFHPYATKKRVKKHSKGAHLLIYVGHGNGQRAIFAWPCRVDDGLVADQHHKTGV